MPHRRYPRAYYSLPQGMFSPTLQHEDDHNLTDYLPRARFSSFAPMFFLRAKQTHSLSLLRTQLLDIGAVQFM